jgi:hypothetical protein
LFGARKLAPPHKVLGRFVPRERGAWLNCSNVIACDKREAFAQGSACDEAIQTLPTARQIVSLALAMLHWPRFADRLFCALSLIS